MKDFQSYVESGYPIIAIPTDDELTVLENIKQSLNGRSIYFWDFIDPGSDLRYPQVDSFEYGDEKLETYIEQWAYHKEGDDCIIVLHNYSCYQSDESNAILRKIAQLNMVRSFKLTFILFIQDPILSPMIAPFSVFCYVKSANKKFINSEIEYYSVKYNLENLKKYKNEISYLLKGLTRFEMKLVLNRLVNEVDESESSDNLAKKIRKFRKPLIDKHKFLRIIDNHATLDEVGGFERFKGHLKSKRKIIQDPENAKAVGVDFPKGLLLVGEPGCGKSLACKATASYFKIPLLCLDISKILGKYLGESESNFEKMLILAENYSPCVLWIDELDKAFSGSNSSNRGEISDVIMRLMGTFLTWLQDHKSNVYVMATANDISLLPKELFRKGRFDEIFYAGKPTNEQEVLNIFNIHLHKRGHAHFNIIDFTKIKMHSAFYGKKSMREAFYMFNKRLLGLTGAEIENEVKFLLENWFYKAFPKKFDEFLVRKMMNETIISKKSRFFEPQFLKEENDLKSEKIGAKVV